MTEREYRQKLNELDRLLNDPAAPLGPAKAWSLLPGIATRTAKFSSQKQAERERATHLEITSA
jgi:hypothetical protein